MKPEIQSAIRMPPTQIDLRRQELKRWFAPYPLPETINLNRRIAMREHGEYAHNVLLGVPYQHLDKRMTRNQRGYYKMVTVTVTREYKAGLIPPDDEYADAGPYGYIE